MIKMRKCKILIDDEWYYMIEKKVGWFRWKEYFGDFNKDKVDKMVRDLRSIPNIYMKG